jgi:hypothetical protein
MVLSFADKLLAKSTDLDDAVVAAAAGAGVAAAIAAATGTDAASATSDWMNFDPLFMLYPYLSLVLPSAPVWIALRDGTPRGALTRVTPKS